MTGIFISVAPKNLLTTLVFENVDSKALTSIRLSLTSFSSEIESKETSLTIPWGDFRYGFLNLLYIFKREKVQVRFDDFTKNLIEDFLDDRKKSKTISQSCYDDLDIVKILGDSGFERKLTIEQMRDLKKLLTLKHGANFSVPGAGKTTTLLAAYTVLKARKQVNKLFVISPLNAFISWEDETNEIFRIKALNIKRLSISDIRKSPILFDETPDIYLINYEKLRGDVKHLFPFFIKNQIHLVVDESHKVKSGYKNISYQQIMKLADIAKRRDILTGTPMPQSPIDLNAQFYMLWRNDILPEFDKSKNDEFSLKELNEAISDKFVRTTKSELGLPDPIIHYSFVDMGPIQAELYRLFKSEFARLLSGMDQNSKMYFRSVGNCVVRLLQAATNPMLLGVENEYSDEVLDIPAGSAMWELLSQYAKYEKSTKIEFLQTRVRQILEQNPNNKVVVWSYFIRNIQLLEKILSEFNPVSIYGAIPTGDDQDEMYREGRIRKFHQDESCRVLIGNPQACGEGISLHRASHFAIYLDRNFNAAYFLQSIDRIHRLGLDKTVDTVVEIIVARNSIDELLINRLNQKAEAMGKVLNDPYLLKLAYDPDDIPSDEILGLDSFDIAEISKHVLNNEEI
jgi:hypothetical protein